MTFLVLNAAVAVTAVSIGVVGPAQSRVFRALCAWLLLVHSLVLGAGLTGWLTARGVTALALIALAAVAWLVRGRRRPAVADDRPQPDRLTRMTQLLAIAAVAVWARPHLVDATRLWIWDDYTYHMVYPVLWLRDHAISAAAPAHAFTMQAWFPLSASVVATWFMLPFAHVRGEALAWVSLTAVLYGAIFAAASAALYARLGCQRGAWAVPLVLFATSHRIGVMSSSFSDADLANAVAMFAAFVFAIPPGDGEDRPHADAWYAALLTGFAVGVKVSAVPAALVILVMLGLRAGRRVVPIFAASWLVTGGYWYARNVVHTGNPLYPAKFLFWPGATFPETTLREYAAHWGFVRAVGDASTVYMNWPVLHASLAVAGAVALIVWLAIRWDRVEPAHRYFAFGALAIAGVVLVLLPSTPYSAGNGMTFAAGLVHWDSMRYVALLPLLGWAAAGFVVNARWPAVVIAVACLWTMGAPPKGSIAWSHAAKAQATADALRAEPLFGQALAVLDELPPGTRVAVFGDQWTYPAFGARHDLDPVRVDADGRLATTLVEDSMTQGPMRVGAEELRANLEAARIDVVAVIHLPHPGRSPEWPAQAAMLDRFADARVLHRDGAAAIWQLPAR